MLIGGAEDKLRGEQILKRFVKLARGAEASIAIVATASEISEQALQLYEGLFLELGVANVTGLRPQERSASRPTPRRRSARPQRRACSSRAGTNCASPRSWRELGCTKACLAHDRGP